MTVIYQKLRTWAPPGRYRVEYRTPDHGWWLDDTYRSPRMAIFCAWADGMIMSRDRWEYRVIDTEGDD